MTSKQIRKKRESQIALNSWYSCMIAMGGIPKDEDLYFETRDRFIKKYNINLKNTKTTCDSEYGDIKGKYYNINKNESA